MSNQSPVILFDGVCNLCNGSVQFVLLRDKAGYFKFTSLQSEAGQALLEKFNLPKEEYNSFILVEGDQIFFRSTAALRVAKKLDGPWKALYVFNIIPAFIRDGVYNFIAKNRYRFFGKRETCMLPRPEWKSRFL